MRGRGMAELEDRKYTMSDSAIGNRLLTYAKPFVPQFLFVFFLMFLGVGLGVVQPFLIGESIDVIRGNGTVFGSLDMIVIIFIVAIIGGSILGYYQTILLQKIGQSIIFNMRNEIFNHLENHDIEYFNNVPTGSLVTRVTNDTNTLNEMYTSVIVNVIRNVLMIIGISTAMFLMNWRLTLLIMIVMPLVAYFSFLFRRFSRPAYRRVRKHLSVMNAFLAEHLSGMKIIQIFNQESKKKDEFEEKNNDLKKSYLRQILIFSIYRPTIYFLFMVATIIIYYYGGMQFLAGTLSLGIMFAFVQYVRRFFEPIQQLAEQYNVLQSAYASSERIFGILDTLPKVNDEDDSIVLEDIKGEIEFKNVWFAYENEEWILKDVSFKVNAKESVAFVGATGAGKTTILALIVRNFDIQKGQILIDGIDITKIKRSSLRSFIGQMLQDVFMFSGTIESNIKLRDENITFEEMKQACEYVNANKFIEKLPNQYDEEVRERGNNFSSGQRQLISFARTIVHKPRVMILDEATSNIDTETEQLIQDSLTKMMTIGTMLIVAHRLSTIQHVDKIIVLSKGEIIESGDHQSLLKQKGHYYNLYRLQYQEDVQ